MLRSLTLFAALCAAALLAPSRAAAQAQAEAMPDCQPAREYDRVAIDSVSRQLRRAMAPRYSEAQIRVAIRGAVEQLRAQGRIRCANAGGYSPAARYGALATGPNAAWGVSWDHDTQAGANARALKECGGRCGVVLHVVGPTCAAYAARRGTYGWGTGADRAEAERRALAECRARAGARCNVEVWGCNSRP
jgi:hypothetical protein